MPRMYSSTLGSGGVPTIVVQSVGDLPATAEVGTIALVLDDNTLYVFNGTSWVLVGGQGNLLGHAGAEAITNGLQTVSVVYSNPMPDTNYSLTATIENLVDSDPIYLEIVSTVKLTTGFTAEFNAPTDSANYVINWKVARSV